MDLLIIDSLKVSIGLNIIFFTNSGLRFEGKILACSDEYLKYFDLHRQTERFVKLSELREAELK